MSNQDKITYDMNRMTASNAKELKQEAVIKALDSPATKLIDELDYLIHCLAINPYQGNTLTLDGRSFYQVTMIKHKLIKKSPKHSYEVVRDYFMLLSNFYASKGYLTTIEMLSPDEFLHGLTISYRDFYELLEEAKLTLTFPL